MTPAVEDELRARLQALEDQQRMMLALLRQLVDLMTRIAGEPLRR